jgi:hypothetical protein
MLERRSTGSFLDFEKFFLEIMPFASCKPITLLTHVGVRKFQFTKRSVGAKQCPVEPKVSNKFASDDASLHGTWS